MSLAAQVNQKNPHVRHGLVVKFNEVPSGGLDYVFKDTAGELNGTLFDLLGDFPVYDISLRVEPTDEMVQVKGQLKGELRLPCSRCAEDFSTNFNKNFVTAFYKSEQSIKNFGWNSDDFEGSFDLEFLEGDEIKLGDVIHEQVALEIPFKPLCSENCKGLCMQCGTNLNSSTCSCKPIDINFESKKSPFEKLKNLKVELT